MPSPEGGGAILVVDDDVDVRQSLEAALELEGYGVVSAASGSEALDILRNAGPPVGVILLDLMMPGMDGWEFRRQQRQIPSAAGVPVVVLSAAGNLAGKLGDLAPDAFLSKPVGIEALVEAISALRGG